MTLRRPAKNTFQAHPQTKQDKINKQDLVLRSLLLKTPHFLQNLPGVTATDSMGYRIEALRVYLEQ